MDQNYRAYIGRSHFGDLDGLRFLCIALVLWHHGNPMLNRGPQIFERGFMGVDFFFVLSGFIILHAHGGDPPGAAAARAYAWKRVTRIYVPYLPVALALIGLYLALPGLSARTREWSLLTSLTLVPTGAPPALAAAWTLEHEMMFYVLFLAFFLARRAFPALIALWVASILVGIGLGLPRAGQLGLPGRLQGLALEAEVPLRRQVALAEQHHGGLAVEALLGVLEHLLILGQELAHQRPRHGLEEIQRRHVPVEGVGEHRPVLGQGRGEGVVRHPLRPGLDPLQPHPRQPELDLDLRHAAEQPVDRSERAHV